MNLLESRVNDAISGKLFLEIYRLDLTEGNHAGLVSRSSISGLDSAFTTSNTTRGNATAVTRWILPSTAVTSYQQ